MAETQANKAPMPLEEGAKRGATYGALFALAFVLVGIILWLQNLNQSAIVDLRTQARENNDSIAKFREQFVEFKAQTNANFQRIEERDVREFKQLHDELAELKELIKQRR